MTTSEPLSFADALEGIARWMDHVEKILVRRGEMGGPSNGKVQADLRRAARFLREDPFLDELMLDAMNNGPDPSPAATPSSSDDDDLTIKF